VSKLLILLERDKMPTYEYSCITCDLNQEVVKSFAEADKEEFCNKCGYALTRVYGSFGIQFKGSGFYKTDNPK
jgi:putative FmdB family regulatory protein